MRKHGQNLGLLLGLMAGTVIGYGLSEGDWPLWVAGLLTCELGALIVLYSVRRSGDLHDQAASRQDRDVPAGLLIGQMLVNYGLITEADLGRALARQARTNKRLGSILVDMRVITYRKLVDVLEEQLSRREHPRSRAMSADRLAQ
jgi:hypothetical protein